MGQKIDDIKKYNIDIVVMGSDWSGAINSVSARICEVIYLPRTRNLDNEN